MAATDIIRESVPRPEFNRRDVAERPNRQGATVMCVRHPSMSHFNIFIFKIKRRIVQSLVDSGSPRSLMSIKIAQQLNLRIYPLEDRGCLVSASGQPLKLVGKAFVPCHINGLCINHTFTIVEHIFPNLLLGTDFLSNNQAVINYRDNTMEILDALISVPLQKFQSVDNCAVINNYTVIPKYSEGIVPVRLPRMYPAEEVC